MTVLIHYPFEAIKMLERLTTVQEESVSVGGLLDRKAGL